MSVFTDPCSAVPETNTIKVRKPRIQFIQSISEAADPNQPIPFLTQSTSCKSTISSLLLSAFSSTAINETIPTNPNVISGNQRKKNNFSSGTFRGFGCSAEAAQRVSVPEAIRASAEWEGKRARRKKKQRSLRQRKDFNSNDGVGDESGGCVVVQDVWCGPGIGFGGGDVDGGSVDCVVSRRTVASSGRGKIDGDKISHRERPSCLARRTVNPETLCFLDSDPPLTRPGSGIFGTRYYDHVRHYSPDGLAEIMMLQSSLLMGGKLDTTDQFRDWRLDVDSMTYEELLELGDRIGYVSSGLREDEIGLCVRKNKHSNDSSHLLTQVELKCSICQEEDEADNEIGKLHCGHGFHIKCIKQWLAVKNTCPVCKAEALGQD